MSQYIVHAAPYSSPNSRKNLRSKWNVQNVKVYQDIPGNPNSAIMAELELVNANNPKDKRYTMRFSFADGTSVTPNAINRIRRFFNEAYDRQRSSSYGFPELNDTEKTQIVARINTAYNQWAGFRHSEEDVDVIDCTTESNDYLSVKMSAIDDLDDNYLEHHGILGMKWGIRRYQNSDGSLTPAGKVRYGSQMAKALQKGDQKSYDEIRSKIKEGSDNDLLEKVANQLNDSGKKASKKNYSDALKKTEAEALENKRKEYARVVKEKVESGKEDNARLYTEYHDDLYSDKDSNVSKTSSEDYKRNGYMSNAERQTFNYAEKACKNLPDDKKNYFLRQLSNSFDAIVRDNPSVLVWDNKKNKIVAYPSSYEFERIPDFDKYRDAWTSGNTIWLFTWGEEYDG